MLKSSSEKKDARGISVVKSKRKSKCFALLAVKVNTGRLVVAVSGADDAEMDMPVPEDKLQSEKITGCTLYDFACALIDGNIKELNELRKILAEEYGIYPSRADNPLEELSVRSTLSDDSFVWMHYTDNEEKPYVPKIIGMVNSKPKRNIKMRRYLLY